MVELLAVNQAVAGSSPAPGANCLRSSVGQSSRLLICVSRVRTAPGAPNAGIAQWRSRRLIIAWLGVRVHLPAPRGHGETAYAADLKSAAFLA